MMAKFLFFILILHVFPLSWSQAQDREEGWDPELTEVWEPKPHKINPVVDNHPPSDAIILFDGTDLDSWEDGSKWNLEDGIMIIEPRTGGIQTTQHFGDIQLHLEWRIPKDVDGGSQGRGNSGIFLQGLYEVQILDSYENETYVNGQAGAIYKQYSPMVNSSLPPGEWQSYDIFFNAPVFRDDGKPVMPAYMTVLHNGVLIHNHVQIQGPTIFRGLPNYEKHSGKLPIFIQGSRHRIAFRNIWVREF